MSDDHSRRISTGATPRPGALPREPRAALVVPIRFRYESILDFVESQSVNISRSGMFLATTEALPIGTVIDFEFGLVDGFVLLRGKGEVARASAAPRGLGVRFQNLDDASRALIDRIVDVNAREGRKPTVAPELIEAANTPAAPATAPSPLRGATAVIPGGVVLLDKDLTVQLSPVTVGYFVYNPLLNIKLGGFVVPVDAEVQLGTILSVCITDVAGGIMFQGKGKVVAKHENRLGVRLSDADKATLGKLQAEAARLTPK
jgi:uncharacterized protein (TIGR02266 family)